MICTDCGHPVDEFGAYSHNGRGLCYECWLGHDGDLVRVNYGEGYAWLRAEEKEAAA